MGTRKRAPPSLVCRTGDHESFIVGFADWIEKAADGREPDCGRFGSRKDDLAQFGGFHWHEVAHDVVDQEANVDQGHIVIALRALQADLLSLAGHFLSSQASRGDQAGRRTGYGGFQHPGEDIVGPGRDGHDKGLGPGPRDDSICTVASEDDQGTATFFSHGFGGSMRVARIVASSNIENLDLDIQSKVFQGASGDTHRVADDDDLFNAGAAGPDRGPCDLVAFAFQGRGRGARGQAAYVPSGPGVGEDTDGPS